MYSAIRPFLFRLDPEITHNALIGLGQICSVNAGEKILSAMYGFRHSSLENSVFGIRFCNPVGLAAGFDKNAKLLSVASSLGFGFLEVGTVTPRPQGGNPKPRLFRLAKQHALVNRMGFNNEGIDIVAKRITRAKRWGILGINIGKNKDTLNEQAVNDYVACLEKVEE